MQVAEIVEDGEIVSVFGAGFSTYAHLSWALTRAPFLIAADSAGNQALQWDVVPDRVVGDLDSADLAPLRACGVAITQSGDQDTTDFQKCLAATRARLVLAVGFLGQRLDHQMATLSAIAQEPPGRVLALGEEDVVFALPPAFEMPYQPGARISFFPMTPVAARSTGLRWDLDGIDLRADGLIATSNEANSDRVRMRVESGILLAILPIDQADAALAALNTQAG